jgi:hypothetical protein
MKHQPGLQWLAGIVTHLRGVDISKASNAAQPLALAMDRLRQLYGYFPARGLADGDFTNHESVIAMHERGFEFFGSFGDRRVRWRRELRIMRTKIFLTI